MTNESDPALIDLRCITKVYRTDDFDTHALHQVSLSIRDGDFVCVSGPSGCGKSTLLAVIGLLEAPSEGEYLLHGRKASDLSAAESAAYRNQEIGFIFQSFNLIGDLTVHENVELPLSYRGIRPRDRRRRVAEVLEKVDLTHRRGHYPSQLSGGQQQRVAIARALAGEPRILLADEPTGNLDSANGENVMGLLEDLNAEGVTLCVVTHDSKCAERASRSVEMLDGKVLDDARVDARTPQPVEAIHG